MKLECERPFESIEPAEQKIVRIIEATQTKERNGGCVF